MENDTKWMMLALNEAKLAQNQGEIPVGSILVKQNTLIARAHNQSILNNDPTAHAEIQLLRKAGYQQKNYRLTKNELAQS